MAKPKKPKPDDVPEEIHDADEEVAEVVDADAEAAEILDADEGIVSSAEDATAETLAGDQEVQEVTEDAEAAAADDDAVAVAEDDEAEQAEEAESEEEVPRLQPRVTVLTLVLCVLVMLTAIGTAVVVVLDNAKRKEWSYAVFLHDLALMGLPFKEESGATSVSRESLPAVNLNPESLKKAHQGRGGKGASESFQPVNDFLVQRIRPEDLGPDTLKAIFQSTGPQPPVKTLDQEVERVKRQLPGDIEAAAREAGKDLNNDDAKRALAEKFLLPLARNPSQVEAIHEKLKKATGGDLSGLLERGCRMRMLAEILGPLEEDRPLKTKTNLLDKLADIDNAKVVEEAEALLQKRIEAAAAKTIDPELFGEEWAGKQRNAQDRREAIAFVLYTVSVVQKPDGKLLYPQGPQRTEVVVGINEFTRAADSYGLALDKLRDRSTARHDAALATFTQQYEDEIRKIQSLRAAIANRQFRLDEYNALKEQHIAQEKKRRAHYDTIHKQILAARKETARLGADLDKLNQELFAAQRRLADAADINAAKEKQIRKLERQKGAHAMIDYLGKGLVLVTVAVSGVFLAWAIGVQTQSIDWGWKDPRKELGERVPSEFDKRVAAVKEAGTFLDRAQAVARDAADPLAVAEQDYPTNVLFYRNKLDEVRSAIPKDEKGIKIEELKYKNGVLVRKDPRATSQPVFEGLVERAEIVKGVEKKSPAKKSTAGYLEDFKKLETAIEKVRGEIDELIEKEAKLTVNLNGIKGKQVGMYELQEKEKIMQDKLLDTMDKLQPLWVRELVDAQLLLARMGRLDQRIEELKKR